MQIQPRPIILVHGLWDTPRVFRRLSKKLEQKGFSVFIPHLPHEYGAISIRNLAKDLETYILDKFGSEKLIDLLGFSMGGLISRFWLQKMGGALRTKRFISVGSPHQGTFTAQLIPACLFAGIAEMKRGSRFLRELGDDVLLLRNVECISFYSATDLMVFPGRQAVLPLGRNSSIPVLTHKGLIHSQISIELIVKEILR